MPDVRTLLSYGRRGLMYELSLYRSLFRWVARRPSVGNGDVPVGYAQLVTPVTLLWIFASAVEVPIVHLLLPWDGIRTAVLVLSLWGLLWMIGLLASLRVHPHLMSASQLRVRHGARIDLPIPWEAIAGITAVHTDLPSSIRTLQPVPTGTGVDLHVAVGGETNVRADLRRPLPLRTPGGVVEAVAVSFVVDDPRDFLARSRERIAAAQLTTQRTP